MAPTQDPSTATADDQVTTFVNGKWVGCVATTRDTPLRTHRITLTYYQFASYLDRLIFAKAIPRSSAGSEGAATPSDPGTGGPADPAAAATTVGAASAPETAETPPSAADSPSPSPPTMAMSNANWFHFATWGTYTLGPNIRNDSAPQRLGSLPEAIRRRVTPTILHTRAEDGDIVGRALSWGQLLIFLSSAKALISFKSQKDRLPPGQAFHTPQADKDALLQLVNAQETTWIDPGHLEIIDRGFSSYALAYRHVRTLMTKDKDPS